jgi:hypothetical protein
MRTAVLKRRLRIVGSWLAVVALGAVAGLGSAWLAIRPAAGVASGAGPWHVNLLAGSADADPYTRARIALGGLLALNREETMYYVASTDSAGAPLRAHCSYRVTGSPPPARWWSVTAYADDLFLFDSPERRHSVNGGTATLDARGRFAFETGPARPAQSDGTTWLPTTGNGGLVLTLRVYNPDASLQAAPASLDPPRIERIGACA